MDRTVIIGANSSWNLLNFRKPIIRALQRHGYRVVAAVPNDGEAAELERMGLAVYPVPVDASGLSPVRDAALLGSYCKMFRELRPRAFLGFTAKPNIYGSIAAALFKVPTINTITGLGTAFLSGRILERAVVILYRLGLRRSRRVFFHNPDDLALFVDRSIVEPTRAAVVPGSGVDLLHFVPERKPIGGEPPGFLFVGRLLRDKGVLEFAKAAAIIRKSQSATFKILGSLEEHPKAIHRHLLQPFIEDGTLEILDPVPDVRPFIAQADCIVLPSYREGLPRVILEASSMAKPAIATNVPGCRQAVDDGATGILCEPGSPESLAAAISAMISMSPDERAAMGARARRKAEREFSDEIIAKAYVDALAVIGS